jgi:HK97 family phage portal protein
MNWFTQIFNNLRAQLRPDAPHLRHVALHNAPHGGQAPLHLLDDRHAYAQSSWVYTAVNRIAEAGALVPLEVKQRITGETIPQHPLLHLLAHPNPVTSQFELLEQTLGTLELTGNAYWYLAGDAQGTPTQIWLLRPDRVTIVPDSEGERYVRGYVYTLDGVQIPLDAVEVVHFKRWHPDDDYYGMSALKALSLTVQGDRAMAQWNANHFGQNQAVPAGIVSVGDFISDTDFERLKRDWRDSYGGTARKTAFIRGGQIAWQNIGMSHNELDFLRGRQAHRDEILNVFGIPIGLISENATEANATVAERQFIERTLYPKLVRLAQKITQEMLPFWGGDVVAHFEDIRPTDAYLRLEEIRTASHALTLNEIRARFYDLPPLAGGDVLGEMPDQKSAPNAQKDTSP